jgi:transposase
MRAWDVMTSNRHHRATSRCIGRTEGGLNSKLHAVCDGQSKPVVSLLTEGQTRDHKGVRLLFDKLPPADALIGDRGYDSNDLREALTERGIKPCIPPTKNRKQAIDYDKALYKQRHKIANMVAKLRDWRRVAMRYDRCAHTFVSDICIAVTILFYL